MIEYNRIEIARMEHCLEVPCVSARPEPRGNERQWTSKRENSRVRPTWHDTPLDPTLERFCGLQLRGSGASEPHERHRSAGGYERLSKPGGIYVLSGIERQRDRTRQPKAAEAFRFRIKGIGPQVWSQDVAPAAASSPQLSAGPCQIRVELPIGTKDA